MVGCGESYTVGLSYTHHPQGSGLIEIGMGNRSMLLAKLWGAGGGDRD